MALVSPNYTNVFSDMGKLIVIHDNLDTGGPTVETDIVEMVQQLDRNYQNVVILPNIINNSVSARNSMSSGAANMVTAMDTYLLAPLKADIVSVSTSASGVLADLISLMVTDLETVALSGSFWTFYDVNYGQDMNSDGAGGETIADTLAQ